MNHRLWQSNKYSFYDLHKYSFYLLIAFIFYPDDLLVILCKVTRLLFALVFKQGIIGISTCDTVKFILHQIFTLYEIVRDEMNILKYQKSHMIIGEITGRLPVIYPNILSGLVSLLQSFPPSVDSFLSPPPKLGNNHLAFLFQ